MVDEEECNFSGSVLIVAKFAFAITHNNKNDAFDKVYLGF